MHPMPREGTETQRRFPRRLSYECILCPVRGRKLIIRDFKFVFDKMHPMPREGTETHHGGRYHKLKEMHPMPREGTETEIGFLQVYQ